MCAPFNGACLIAAAMLSHAINEGLCQVYPTDCSSAMSESTCHSSDCVWSSDTTGRLGICRNATSDFGCPSYVSQATCDASADCGWGLASGVEHGTCQSNPESASSCSLNSYDQMGCSYSSFCVFNQTSNMCEASSQAIRSQAIHCGHLDAIGCTNDRSCSWVPHPNNSGISPDVYLCASTWKPSIWSTDTLHCGRSTTAASCRLPHGDSYECGCPSLVCYWQQIGQSLGNYSYAYGCVGVPVVCPAVASACAARKNKGSFSAKTFGIFVVPPIVMLFIAIVMIMKMRRRQQRQAAAARVRAMHIDVAQYEHGIDGLDEAALDEPAAAVVEHQLEHNHTDVQVDEAGYMEVASRP